MKCPNQNCEADTDNKASKFCSECGTKLPRNAESIPCNGKDEGGKPCRQQIKLGTKYCSNCGRKVDQAEFLLGNCLKCGDHCPASNKICVQCSQTDTSETNERAHLDKYLKESFQTLTGSSLSFPTCEHCGKVQLDHWSFCLYCGKKHLFKPRDQGATGTEEHTPLRTNDGVREERYRADKEDLDDTQSQMETLYVDEEFIEDIILNMGSDEVDDDIWITVAEAVVIQRIFDNDKSTKTNSPAIKNVSDHSTSTSAEAAPVQNSFAQLISTKEKVAAYQKMLDLRRPIESEVAVNKNVSDQAHYGSVKKLAGLVNADAIHDPVEAEKFQKVIDQCGYSDLMKILEKSNTAWRDTTIKIAVTGESGSGKSSLINAISGRMDDDPGAAHTDCIEATKEPTPYPHPHNKNLVFWDLPGVDTPNFHKETYIEDARFDEYDFIILVSCSRYNNNDTWLAQQIQSRFPDANLIFVRTKIDNDLDSKRTGRRIPYSDDKIKKVFNAIKHDCYKNLKDANIKSPHVFLVNNHEHSEFEFGNLCDMLLDISVLKKDALVMTIQSFTQQIVAAKYERFTKSLGNISKQAAVAAVRSNRENGERLEIDILKKEVMEYKKQLGIDEASLDIIAQRFGIDMEEVYIKMDSETHVFLRRFEQYYIDNDKVATQYDSFPWYRKIFYNKIRMYQKQCYSLLKTLLKKCVKENKTLQKHIAVWSTIPK